MSVVRVLAETEDTVTLSRADFEALVRAREDAIDNAAFDAAEQREARLGKEDAQTKESEQFCKSLAASAVRVAQLEKEASAREMTGARRVGNGAASGGAVAGAPAAASNATAGKSLDEIVKFIQGGSKPAQAKKKGKTGRK